jgi:hypothetical protein
MNPQSIFILQIVLSVITFAVIAKSVVALWLAKQSTTDALFWLTIPHAFRHMGLVFLVPGVRAQELPDYFALPAAYGELATGVLALVALILLRIALKPALMFVWLFNVVGTINILNALRHVEVVPAFGSTWYIPTLVMPLLLVTHFMIFVPLVKKGPDQ